MEWLDIEVDGRHTVKFADLPYVPLASPSQSPDPSDLFIGKKQGGFLRHGEWGWLARNASLQIVSLRSGQTISSYEFCESRGYDSCCIKCVEEIFPNRPEVMLLAVVLESFRGPGNDCSYVAFYSIELSTVVHSIELSLHLTCSSFVKATACRRTLLQNFDGCLAVGSEEGVLVLLDLNMRKLTSKDNGMQADSFVPCHIVDYSLSLTEIHRNFRQCQLDGIHFGLQMEVIESPCSIQSILPIDLILGLAIGLEDGRMALYDLAELQIFYVALPHQDVTMSALVKMDFLEPLDDPRPCLFIWALHENGENLHAVLHNLMYQKRLVDDEESVTYFESFQTSSVRLQLPLEATKSTALACQAISTLSNHSADDSNCLCAISWLSVLEGKNKLLIFDLNQWYKEEMPFLLEYGKQPNYLAGYILNGECNGLNTLLNPNNITHFNSMQRFEEHFYPNSLSFESLLLHTEGCRRYNWEGAQNRVINLLRSSNAAIFLEPNLYFNEIIRTRLMPQFIDLNVNSTFSRNAKYEILLSAALEHNCVSLLRDCAKSWIDGSFMGNFAAATGLSLSTLTEWIWKRATCIKSRCNDLCKSLFEFGGYPLDSREQRELGFLTRQLKLLTDLLKEILVYAKKQIPERVLNDLENKQSSLAMASSYQDILLWLLNIGLLPEASPHSDKINARHDLIPYPYKELKEFYKRKRSLYAKINESFISKKTGSCKLLFIDSFIEHVCKGNILHEYWLENEGNGLYPPNSLEAMLRIMLVPDLDYDNKCAILLYFFLDLNMAIDEEVYKDVVANFIKFPSVFKLSAPLIKTVQAFWNLDHDHYLPAVDEFISPFNKNQCYPQWQVELLIEVLLNQNASNLALRILESQPSLISPLLKLNTLLLNELISEAFHFVRSKNDDSLLETFFSRCLRNGQFGVIRDLALSEREGLILQNILRKSKSPGAESLHFVYLLQKSKYIEAVSYMEELSNKAKGIKSSLHQTSQMDTPNLVLSAFNTTMTPMTQGLTDVYFRIKNKLKKKEVDNQSPVPLSCQLIKQNANSLLGGIYHSSALSAHFATYYWGEMEEQTKQAKHLLNSNNAPFLRRPQIDSSGIDYLAKNNISYPQAYKATEKRNLLESGVLDSDQHEFERHKLENKLNPKKKRRLIGQEIVDDLSHFMKTNKPMSTSTASEFTFGPEKTSESEQMENKSFDLLTRPSVAKSTRREKEAEDIATSVPEIHGILKTNTNSDLDQQQREPLPEEEKSLRFRLPSTDAGSSQAQMEVTPSKDSVKVMDEQQVEVKITVSPKLKNFTRSVSVESNKSSHSSSNESVENFYSPLSSHNNSKLDSSNLSRCSILSGPQPRRSLARLSREPSEKSLTPEPEMKKADSCSVYATALESDIKSKISPRNSIERFNPELAKPAVASETLLSKESNNAAYITAVDTFSKPMTFSSAKPKEGVTQTTSDFGKIGSHQTLAESKIDEFLPKDTSSKVGAKEDEKFTQPAKLSECSTIVGSFASMEYTGSTINNVSAVANVTEDQATTSAGLSKHTDEQKRHMLETTLGMSTYDISIYEFKSIQQTKSSVTATTEEGTFCLETRKEIKAIKLTGEETESQLNQTKADAEQANKNTVEMPKQSTSIPSGQGEESYDECIILSSSSSSSATSQEQDDDYANNYSDYERSEEDETQEYLDYEREVEDEDDVHIQDNIGDENSDTEEDYDSYMYNEDIDDGMDELDNNEELSMDETNSSSAKEKADVIQLIEDSSSDESPDETNQYDESDSDDIKLVEDETPISAVDKSQLPARSAEESQKEISIHVGLEEKDDLNEAKHKEENIIEDSTATNIKSPENSDEKSEKLTTAENKTEILTVTTNKSSSVELTEEHSEKLKASTTTSNEKSRKLTTTTSSEIDIRIDENASTSKTETEIIHKELEDLKKEDATTSSDNRDQRTDITNSANDKENNSEHSKQESVIASSGEQEVKLNVIDKDKSSGESDSTDKEKMSKVLKSKEASTCEQKDKQDISEKAQVDTGNASKDVEEKSEDVSQKTALTVTTDQKEKQEQINEKPEDTESDANDVKSSKTAEKFTEENNQPKSNNERRTDKMETNEAMEDEPISLRMEESLDDGSEENIVNKSSVEENTVEQKSEDMAETETVSEKEESEKILKVSEIEVGSQNLEVEAKKIKSDTDEKAREEMEEKSQLSLGKAKISEKEDTKLVKNKESEENTAPVVIQRKRKTSRGASAPPMDLKSETEAIATSRKHIRGTSVPPQTILESEERNVTPRTRRSIRASSLQPKHKDDNNEMGTPRKLKKTHDSEETETKIERGSSVPPGAVEGKLSTRRRSVLLDSISEDPKILNSPSTRTRSKSRLTSVDSEVDSPLVTGHSVEQKRTRRMSITNNPSETSRTPKRTRLDSLSSQPEITATVSSPRSLRSRSVLSVQEEDTESVSASPKSTGKKVSEIKSKKNSDAPATEQKEQIKEISPKGEQSATSDVSYSASRRLTRTQLAMMEKSAVLSQKLPRDELSKQNVKISPPQNKRPTKSRSTRSSNLNADSDDAESVSSKLSTVSSATGSKRRVTRSSLKEKEDGEDDGASVASSVGSERHLRHAKEKSSPNTTLTTIPEEASIETRKRGRSTKH